MPTPRVSRGRKTQELLAEYLRANGFPHAASRPASLPGEDIMFTGDTSFEVKATERQDFTGALRQAEKNAAGKLPAVVYRPRGYGPERITDWLVIVSLEDFVPLIRGA